MGLIIKCDPVHIDEDGRFTTTVKKYRKPVIQRDDMAFVWESETSKGSGLTYRGKIVELSDLGSSVELIFEIDSRRLERRLNLSSIREFRDYNGDCPKSELAGILYKHSLNKITTISAACVEFLDGHFNAVPSNFGGPE